MLKKNGVLRRKGSNLSDSFIVSFIRDPIRYQHISLRLNVFIKTLVVQDRTKAGWRPTGARMPGVHLFLKHST